MKHARNNEDAFTLVEVMVAMVVLAIGLLGMAGMTLMVIKGGTDASRMTYATNLASDKMEGLKDIDWDDLGSESCSPITSAAFIEGCLDQDILIEDKLNQQGLNEAQDPDNGPYSFIRKWVVCKPGEPDDAENATDNSAFCVDNSSLRPKELECTTADVNANEKKIKVVVGWRDKGGRCHKVSMNSIMVNL